MPVKRPLCQRGFCDVEEARDGPWTLEHHFGDGGVVQWAITMQPGRKASFAPNAKVASHAPASLGRHCVEQLLTNGAVDHNEVRARHAREDEHSRIFVEARGEDTRRDIVPVEIFGVAIDASNFCRKQATKPGLTDGRRGSGPLDFPVLLAATTTTTTTTTYYHHYYFTALPHYYAELRYYWDLVSYTITTTFLLLDCCCWLAHIVSKSCTSR